ncbi:hypothetical protein C8035_v008532 [Colletotrichum spinosum]|uniref:Uncharacterized protein n=1 Tax=Colletotrichum spinosum TaxID=1347390 RepID=A0A4V3HQI4_9PEZI|nr:hypothetical protein C8035_v008532 [Colletotrichum spinosum]
MEIGMALKRLRARGPLVESGWTVELFGNCFRFGREEASKMGQRSSNLRRGGPALPNRRFAFWQPGSSPRPALAELTPQMMVVFFVLLLASQKMMDRSSTPDNLAREPQLPVRHTILLAGFVGSCSQQSEQATPKTACRLLSEVSPPQSPQPLALSRSVKS